MRSGREWKCVMKPDNHYEAAFEAFLRQRGVASCRRGGPPQLPRRRRGQVARLHRRRGRRRAARGGREGPQVRRHRPASRARIWQNWCHARRREGLESVGRSLRPRLPRHAGVRLPSARHPISLRFTPDAVLVPRRALPVRGAEVERLPQAMRTAQPRAGAPSISPTADFRRRSSSRSRTSSPIATCRIRRQFAPNGHGTRDRRRILHTMKPLRIGIVVESTGLPLRPAIAQAAKMAADGMQVDAQSAIFRRPFSATPAGASSATCSAPSTRNSRPSTCRCVADWTRPRTSSSASTTSGRSCNSHSTWSAARRRAVPEHPGRRHDSACATAARVAAAFSANTATASGRCWRSKSASTRREKVKAISRRVRHRQSEGDIRPRELPDARPRPAANLVPLKDCLAHVHARDARSAEPEPRPGGSPARRRATWTGWRSPRRCRCSIRWVPDGRARAGRGQTHATWPTA